MRAFAGSALVISHDRWFLDRIATHILAFEGDSQVFGMPALKHSPISKCDCLNASQSSKVQDNRRQACTRVLQQCCRRALVDGQDPAVVYLLLGQRNRKSHG